MSNYVINAGFMAELKTPINQTEYSEIIDKLLDTNLQINYEGTLLFSTDIDKDLYEGGIIFDNLAKDEFISKSNEHNLEIIVETIKSYTCVWYNGADSEMSTLKLEEFRKN